MTRRNSILGALLASALCLCAFGASNALAVKSVQLHECKESATGTETTAVEFADAGCQEVKTPGGKFRTALVEGKANLTTYTTGSSTLSTIFSGVKVKIECSTLMGEGTGENTAEAFKGSGKEVFTGCKVVEPSGKGCVVPEPISTNPLSIESNGMKVNYSPPAGMPFGEITIEGATCPVFLVGRKPVTGTASGEVTEGSPTTVEFTATSGSALKFGGQAATFIANGMVRTPEGADISLETP